MKKSGKKNSAVVSVNKGKINNSSKLASPLTMQSTEKLIILEEPNNFNSTIKTNEQNNKKCFQDNQTSQIQTCSPCKFNTSHQTNLTYKGSFQCPSYYIKEIPEPKIRSEITKNKISKLESYLSLCEEFYLGNFVRSKSISDLFQSLIVSHNINSNERLEALIKKESSINDNPSTKPHVKVSSKNAPTIEPVMNAEEIISPLDLLIHPFRNKDIIDLWGPHEVILFECAMCKYGKEFDKIQRIIKTKTTKEIVDFYYCIWKRTNRYKAWKHSRQLSEYIFS